MVITHVFFDFFGTLVDYSQCSVGQGYERSHRLLQDAGAEMPYPQFLDTWDALFDAFEQRALRDLVEYSMDDAVSAYLQQVLGRAPASTLVDRIPDAYLSEWDAGVRHIEGVAPLLHRLASEFALVLVTNTHRAEFVRAHLDRMEVTTCFTAVITSIEHGRRKPSRCIFERAMTCSGATPEATIHVGDSYSADYAGAAGVGIRALLIDPDCTHPIAARDRLRDILSVEAALTR